MKILLTGGGNGIGRKISRYLEKKHDIYVIDKNINENKKNFKCDLRDIQKLELISKKIKKVDVIINNAGISFSSKNNFQNFDDIVKINLNGPYYVCSLFLNQLRQSQYPSIINICSLNSHQAFPNNPGYVSSKSGLLGLTRALALDYGKYNIKVNSISPGYIADGMSFKSFKSKNKNKERSRRTIFNKWGKASDLFGIIDYLISQSSSYTTGQDFVIDGGWLAKGL